MAAYDDCNCDGIPVFRTETLWMPTNLIPGLYYRGYRIERPPLLGGDDTKLVMAIDHQDHVVYIDQDVDPGEWTRAVNEAYREVVTVVPAPLPLEEQLPVPAELMEVPMESEPPQGAPKEFAFRCYAEEHAAFLRATRRIELTQALAGAAFWFCSLKPEEQAKLWSDQQEARYQRHGTEVYWRSAPCKLRVTLSGTMREVLEVQADRWTDSGLLFIGGVYEAIIYGFAQLDRDSIEDMVEEAAGL